MEEDTEEDRLNFQAYETDLGRNRGRKWVPLITQQLRLRHLQSLQTYLTVDDRKRHSYHFTLHHTEMSCPFYTSQSTLGPRPCWSDIEVRHPKNRALSAVVFRLWQDEKLILTWGVNFSGLAYLGPKPPRGPKLFHSMTVIFSMAGGYFTAEPCLRDPSKFPYLNVVNTPDGGSLIYRKVAIKLAKTEVTTSYNLAQLLKLQSLQRKVVAAKLEVGDIKRRIQKATERDSIADDRLVRSSQLLTMNSLQRMLHEKPTRAQRERMVIVAKQIEEAKFRNRMLRNERDRSVAVLKQLKKTETKLTDENEEFNSDLMSKYHVLSKESPRWTAYIRDLAEQRARLADLHQQLYQRQTELLRELLFIYPISKKSDENLYTVLGIPLPDSEQLLDCQDPGVSVVLGYVCHILLMCSIFLQVPLRHPVKHFGSRSSIFDQVYADLTEKEREFPLYTKGRDRALFSYAVFLLNKNIKQLRWYFHRKPTPDLKETLKNVHSLLLGEDLSSTTDPNRRPVRPSNISEGQEHSLVSTANLTDPILDRIHAELRLRLDVTNRSPQSTTTTDNNWKKKRKKRVELLTFPEAYLTRQISLEEFHRIAEDGAQSVLLTDIEQGTDPLAEEVESHKWKHSVSTTTSGESSKVKDELTSPLTERTIRLLSTTRSFNLVKHRPPMSD